MDETADFLGEESFESSITSMESFESSSTAKESFESSNTVKESLESSKSAKEALFRYFDNTSKRMIPIYNDERNYKLFEELKERYDDKILELNELLKETSLDWLALAANRRKDLLIILDPDYFPEKLTNVSKIAQREIHRRAFKGFTMLPSRKKHNPYDLGFLRKPKF